jgi:hypothetical protein
VETTKQEDRKTWNGLHATAADYYYYYYYYYDNDNDDDKVKMTIILKMELY